MAPRCQEVFVGKEAAASDMENRCERSWWQKKRNYAAMERVGIEKVTCRGENSGG